MKEFRVLLTCNVCGETFDSDYTLTKHMSKSHPQSFEKKGWMGADGEHSCSCGGGGGHQQHAHGH
jgi:hypothetical protein